MDWVWRESRARKWPCDEDYLRDRGSSSRDGAAILFDFTGQALYTAFCFDEDKDRPKPS